MTSLTKHRINTPEQALAYITECTLATVSSLSYLARPPKAELARQISIAQIGIDHLRGLDAAEGCVRARDILLANISVEDWSKSLIAKKGT